MQVFLEILVVTGVKEHTALNPFIVDLLQGYRSCVRIAASDSRSDIAGPRILHSKIPKVRDNYNSFQYNYLVKLMTIWLRGNHERRLQSTRTQQWLLVLQTAGRETNYHSTHCRTEEEAREYAEAVLQGKSPKEAQPNPQGVYEGLLHLGHMQMDKATA